jgi:predicted PurR-regulated permease PerM
MTLILFVVGLATFPSLGQAIAPPLCFIALTTVEGHFITPAIMGRRLTLSPLMVFMALAFWTWLWGPVGAFLAVPLAIIALVTLHHMLPAEEAKLPE